MKIPAFLTIDRRDILIAALTILGLILFVPVFTYAYFAKDLGSKEQIMNLKDTGVVFLSEDGKPFFSFYQGKYKTFVPLNQIPKVTQEAVIASEDKGFYSHSGFSFDAIFRSLLADIQSAKLDYGGSTITQQLVKNSLLSSNKNFLRKYQEVVLAQELERRYTKPEILEMYLNSVYFGNGAFGVEQASQNYFGKDASELGAAESAMLSGLLPAPSKYSPVGGDPSGALLRQRIVLQKMQEQGYLTPAQKQLAENQKLTYRTQNEEVNQIAPHFALMVLDQLKQKYGEEAIARSGFKVTTTLNLDWQKYTEKVVKDQVASLSVDEVSNGAAVVEDPKTGEIRALVGSKDWYDNKFGKVNIATSPRQPGSSFKPIVYSSALEQRMITPATQLHDSPTTFNQCPGLPQPLPDSCLYKPKDFDGKTRGLVTMRRALSNSLNIPAVEVMQKVGVDGALSMAKRLGISTLGDDSSKYGLSLVLGAGEVKLLEQTNVYATLANQGKYNEPVLIKSISDKFGNNIYSYTSTPTEVMDPGVAFQISSILSDNNTRSEEFGNTLNISRLAAVKTGTTEDFKDAWTLGYTPSLTVGVWVGNNDNTPMDNIAGSLGAAPIWRSLMEKFLSGTPVEAFKKPDDVVLASACSPKVSEASSSGKTTTQLSGEYFLVGTQIQGCSSTASPSAQLSLSSPSPSSTTQPSAVDNMDCLGPDGKHSKLSQKDCEAFNKAWGK